MHQEGKSSAKLHIHCNTDSDLIMGTDEIIATLLWTSLQVNRKLNKTMYYIDIS